MLDNKQRAKIYHDKYYYDPNRWVKEVLGITLWSKQRDILDSVFSQPRTAVRASHGVGKTFVAACAVLAFAYIRFPCKIITSAPTYHQVANLLWSEISSLHKVLKEKGFPGECLTTRLKIKENWFSIGISPRESVNFQGFHSPHILVVLDECPGIRGEIIEGAETLLSSSDSHSLWIGNPTTTAGHFYNAFKDPSVSKMHISSFDSPNFTGEKIPPQAKAALVSTAWVEDKKKRWGEKSAIYQSRVLGNFPTESVNTIIPLMLAEEATNRTVEKGGERELSLDIARFGDDLTTMGIREGNIIEPDIELIEKQDTVYIANAAERRIRDDKKIVRVKIDTIGVGGGVYDILENSVSNIVELIPIVSSERAYDHEKYYNKRAEMWFNMADWLKTGSIPDDPDLLADLTIPQYTYNTKGRYQVQSKEEIKKELGRSTDRGDMVVQACYENYGLSKSSLRTHSKSHSTRDLLNNIGIGGD